MAIKKLETLIAKVPMLRRLMVRFEPRPDDRDFVARAETQANDGVEASLAVLDAGESRRFFGVPMALRGVQPVWVRISNKTKFPYRLSLVGIDANYYSAYEAALRNHFSGGKRVLGFGLMAFLFLPILILIPISLFRARRANRRMDKYFHEQSFPLRPVLPGMTMEGFVFTPLDEGNKNVQVHLLSVGPPMDFTFAITVPGLAADHYRRELDASYRPEDIVECDLPALRQRLLDAPATTVNRWGTRSGDPVNLVVIGPFDVLLAVFCSRWDETETITLGSCWKTLKAFLSGAEYRYSPVSPLYLFGRSQEFALQRIRGSINDRLHLRLWATPLRFRGQPVWIGQVSRDIGVSFTWRTWSLTTHKIDPQIDESRDYVIEDLLQSRHAEELGYVDGVGATTPENARRNLTGDAYFTDGKRAVVVVSKPKVAGRLISWD